GPVMLLDEAVLGGFFVLADGQGAPARWPRLSALAGREPGDRSHDDDAVRCALDHRAAREQCERRYGMSPRHPPVPSRGAGSVGENPVSDSSLTGPAELPFGVDELLETIRELRAENVDQALVRSDQMSVPGG